MRVLILNMHLYVYPKYYIIYIVNLHTFICIRIYIEMDCGLIVDN